MATSLQRISLKAEEDKQYAAAVGAQKMLYELLLRRKMDHFTCLAAAKLTAMYFRVPVARDISLDKRLEKFAESGAEPQGFTFTHTN